MKTRMGRPLKDPNDAMTGLVFLRVKQTEKIAYDCAADASGLRSSEWMRLILNKASDKYAGTKQ